jgi:hypothetical protein
MGSKKGRYSQSVAWEAYWQWRDRDGTWISYSENDSARIDLAMDRRESACAIVIDAVAYTVDLQKMFQRRSDVDTKLGGGSYTTYAVRRWLSEWNEDRGLTWNKRIRELYPSWDSQTSSLQVHPVNVGTSDYEKVACKLFDFEGSLSKETHEICRIVRVQNLETFIMYANERDSIIRRRGGGSSLFGYCHDTISPPFCNIFHFCFRSAQRGLLHSWHKNCKPPCACEK